MKLLAIALLTVILLSSSILTHELYAKSKAEKSITKAIGRAVEGNWKSIDMVNISKFNDGSTLTVYNKTSSPIIPPIPPVPPVPVPVPQPSGNNTKIALVGDLSGTSVRDAIKKSNPNLVVALGDLGYKSDLSSFKKDWGGSFKNLKCVIGNHDATEDGSSAIYKEALAYCGDHWSLKIGNSTLMIGMNTNGDSTEQLAAAKQALAQNSQVKTVIFVSHKSGHVPPNSHHPAEASKLYQQLEQLIPTSVKSFEVVGHNHVSSSAPSKNWYQAGAGGKSFYSCGTDVIWTYCDNTKVGYLELTISNTDGTTAAKFIN